MPMLSVSAAPALATGWRCIRCAKEFYVSPFIDMDARYDFHVAEPGERLALVIRESEHGDPLLIASQVRRAAAT